MYCQHAALYSRHSAASGGIDDEESAATAQRCPEALSCSCRLDLLLVGSTREGGGWNLSLQLEATLKPQPSLT